MLHWSTEAAPIGGRCSSGDIVQVIPDRRYVGFMYSYPNLIPLPAAAVEAIAAALAPFEFDSIHGAWWDRFIERDGSAVVRRSADRYVTGGHRARAAHVARGQSRSTFGSRNPSAMPGQRGQAVQVEVHGRGDRHAEPGDERTNVGSTRSPKRAAAPRKSAKKSRSGTPRFAAACSPGTGNANESTSKTCAWCATICFVGPRQTEYASTHGMMHATSTTQDTRLEEAEEPPAEQRRRAEPREVREDIDVGDRRARPRATANASADGQQPARAAQRQREQHERERRPA